MNNLFLSVPDSKMSLDILYIDTGLQRVLENTYLETMNLDDNTYIL